MELIPIHFDEAKAFILKHHRHHKPPVSHKFSIACADDKKIIGVAIIGRPVNRFVDDGFTLEVTRLCGYSIIYPFILYT